MKKKTSLATAGPRSPIDGVSYMVIADSGDGSGKIPGLGKNLGISDTGGNSSA